MINDLQPISPELRGIVYEEVYTALQVSDSPEPLELKPLSESEAHLLSILYRAGDHGYSMEELRSGLKGVEAVIPKSERAIANVYSRLRRKVSSYFNCAAERANSKAPEIEFSLSTNRPGRKGVYRLKWRRSAIICKVNVPHKLVKLAFAKQRHDYDYSVLTNGEVFKRSYELVRDSVTFMVGENAERGLGDRMPEATRRISLPQTMSRPELVNEQVRARCARILATDLKLNCECIEVGALTALHSIKRKYGLGWAIDEQDQSGKMQMERAAYSNEWDFLITANGPFFLFGEGQALRYRFVAPVHAEAQVLLRRGAGKLGACRIVVYNQSSAYEEYLHMKVRKPQESIWGVANPWPVELLDLVSSQRVKPEYVDTLVEMTHRAARLERGDMIIAWPPLSDNLKLEHPDFVQIGSDFIHWISIYCRDDRLDLADEFLSLFAYEFETCSRFRKYAQDVLLADEAFWYYFGGGAGIQVPRGGRDKPGTDLRLVRR